MPASAFSRDPCPVCGAPALIDARADDNDYTPPPNSECWGFTKVCFDFRLTCRACRASLKVADVDRCYWPSTGKIAYILDPGESNPYILDTGKNKRRISSLRGRELRIHPSSRIELDDPDALAQHKALEKQLWKSRGPTQATLETLKSGDWHPRKLDRWLRAAIYYGKVALIAPLVDMGASLDQTLPWALANRQVEAALALLAYDVDPNEALDKAVSFSRYSYWPTYDWETWRPLLPHIQFDFWKMGPVTLTNMLNLAVLYRAPELVERLLAKGATLERDADHPYEGNQQVFICLSPWSLAILTGQPELVERFWGTGPLDPGHALYCALCAGREDIARRLLAEGVDLWEGSRWVKIESNLHAAARGGMTWAIDLWATREPDLARGQPAEAITPLHIAARHLHPGTARRLLEYGTDPNASGLERKGLEFKRTLTPLHEAIEPLIREGIDDPRILDAAMEIVELLLSADADPNVGWKWVSQIEVDGYASIWKGRFLTPLTAALGLQFPPLFDLLIQHGTNVNKSVRRGNLLVKALMLVIQDQDPHHFFDKLLALGADPRTGNRYQKSPMEIARKHERPDLVQILEEQDRKIHGDSDDPQ